MSAPLLRSLSHAPATVRPLLPALPEGVPAFVVVREGDHGAWSFAAGDVLVCRGEAAHGDAVVLVPGGHGRPRLGEVVGGTLRGDAGEPCSPLRWQAAGKLVACYRLGVDGWVVQLLEPSVQLLAPRPAVVPAATAAPRQGERPAPMAAPAGQLSLFAA